MNTQDTPLFGNLLRRYGGTGCSLALLLSKARAPSTAATVKSHTSHSSTELPARGLLLGGMGGAFGLGLSSIDHLPNVTDY